MNILNVVISHDQIIFATSEQIRRRNVTVSVQAVASCARSCRVPAVCSISQMGVVVVVVVAACFVPGFQDPPVIAHPDLIWQLVSE